MTLSHMPEYVISMTAALKEMHRHVGNRVINGLAVRKIIIRHLVHPENSRAVTYSPELQKIFSRDL